MQQYMAYLFEGLLGWSRAVIEAKLMQVFRLYNTPASKLRSGRYLYALVSTLRTFWNFQRWAYSILVNWIASPNSLKFWFCMTSISKSNCACHVGQE